MGVHLIGHRPDQDVAASTPDALGGSDNQLRLGQGGRQNAHKGGGCLAEANMRLGQSALGFQQLRYFSRSQLRQRVGR